MIAARLGRCFAHALRLEPLPAQIKAVLGLEPALDPSPPGAGSATP
jgi:hypothetical protein